MNRLFSIWVAAGGFLVLSCAQGHRPPSDEVRLGYFPNITHAAALVGMARGDFERAVAPMRLVPRVFNAGPQAIEALFAGELDVVYVGSGPAINAYVRSRGRALRVVAGAASGGAGLVVRGGSGIRGAADLGRVEGVVAVIVFADLADQVADAPPGVALVHPPLRLRRGAGASGTGVP